MLSKRSIKNEIQLNGSLTTKEHIVELSKNWSEKEINLFKKMTSQGGSFKIQGINFTTTSHDVMLDSSGRLINISSHKMNIDGDIDLNYLQ